MSVSQNRLIEALSARVAQVEAELEAERAIADQLAETLARVWSNLQAWPREGPKALVQWRRARAWIPTLNRQSPGRHPATATAEAPDQRSVTPVTLIEDSTETAAERRAVHYAAIRRLLDGLEAAGIDPPHPFEGLALQIGFVHNPEGLRGRDGIARMLRIARAAGLLVTKEAPGDHGHRDYQLTHPDGTPFGHLYTPAGETCERVQVGSRTVERPVMVQHGTETVEEPVYEWRCSPVLAPEAEIPL